MIGERVEWPQGFMTPGQYAKNVLGIWYACTPSGMYANLENHDIEEHEDGTITVSPSILVRGGTMNTEWHGYLERGVWRQC